MWTKQEPVLSVRGLRKSFANLDVLNGVDLEVRPGEVLGVIGQNGVGKSTMASIIAGGSDPDDGEVILSGGYWDPNRVMLIDPEEELDPDLTVIQAMFRRYTGDQGESARQAAARRALAESGVPLMPTDRLGDLSDSERRLVEVVRMLADPRELIVIDELSSTLNAREVDELRYALDRAVEEERGVVYITHRLEEALQLCHRIAVLRDGRVTKTFNSLDATTDELTEAMFGQVVTIAPRRGFVTDDVLMDVVDLQCTGQPISFQLRAGEVLGVSGARDSGVEELRDALTGDRPSSFGSLTVGGRPASIQAPRDLPALRIAVLGSMLDPGNETRQALNLTLLDGEDADRDDATIEETTRILMALRQSELVMSRLLNRPVQSTGQRRWQQMQDLAAQHADILILIEPMLGLDVSARAKITRMLEEVTARGVGVLLFTSDEKDLHLLSDRIMVLADGAVRTQWDPSQITVQDLQAVSLGEWSTSPVRRPTRSLFGAV